MGQKKSNDDDALKLKMSVGKMNSPSKGGLSQFWTVSINSPQITLSTKVDHNWSVKTAIDRVKNKFPSETNYYVFFLETDKNFLLLDENSILSSFPQMKDGVRFYHVTSSPFAYLMVFLHPI